MESSSKIKRPRDAEGLAVTSRSPAKKDSRPLDHWTLGEARSRSREAERQTCNDMLGAGYPFWFKGVHEGT